MIILDTQVWVWWVNDDRQLPVTLRLALQTNEDSGFAVSAISLLEVARLVTADRLVLPLPAEDWLLAALQYPRMSLVNLTPEICVLSTKLPEPFHRDPADRLVVATAIARDAVVATTDAKIRAYPHVRTLEY